MVFTVHSIPGSSYGRSVLMVLEEKGAEYRLAAIKPGESRTPAYLARHPFAKIPVLEHGDFRLYETQAILRYLDRVLLAPPLTPTDPRAAARMDQLLNINDCYLFRGVNDVIGFQRIVGPRLMGITPDEAVIAAAMPKAKAVVDELSRLLGDQATFTGEAVSLADLALAAQLEFLAMTPEWQTLSAATPNLVSWLARMLARPSLQATTWDEVTRMARAA